MKDNRGIITAVREVVMPLLVYYLVRNLIQILGFTYLESMKENLQFSLLKAEAYLLLRGVLLVAVLLITTLCIFPYYQYEKSFLSKRQFSKKEAVLLPLGAAVLAIGINYLWSLIPLFTRNQAYQQVAKSQYSYPLWLGLILYVLAAPLVEEVMFRGIIYNIFCRNSSPVWGVILSAVLFGAFHGNIVQASYGMIMGILMACLYEKYHDLRAPLLFHSGANGVVYLLQHLMERF